MRNGLPHCGSPLKIMVMFFAYRAPLELVTGEISSQSRGTQLFSRRERMNVPSLSLIDTSPLYFSTHLRTF